MTRLLLLTLLVLSHRPVYAEWVAIDMKYQSPGLRTVYSDPTAIRREGDLVTLEILVDWKWMQGNVGMGIYPGPHRFFSTKNTKQFDCAEKRVRLLAFTEYYGRMATGRAAAGYVDQDNWLPVEPESVNRALWELACDTP